MLRPFSSSPLRRPCPRSPHSFALLRFAGFALLSIPFTLALAAPSAQATSANLKFKVRPLLNLSLSSSDLSIPDLVPDTGAKQSNIIDVTISTTSTAGYTLSASVGNTTNYFNTTDLKYDGSSTDKFTHLSVSDNLTSLTTDNTWGYSIDEGAHYSGLPPYPSFLPKTLKNATTSTTDVVKFSIGARAGTGQTEGNYKNVIRLTAVANPSLQGLAEAYQANGKTKVTKPGTSEEYYTMQDMTPDICEDANLESTLKVLDTRDNKVYWITKLKMNRAGTESACWMTQNLAFNLNTATTLTPDNTDIPAPWTPATSTINFTGGSVPGWTNSNTTPSSANPGDIYYYTSNSNDNDITYTSLSACTSAGHTADECKHYSVGNYYNFTSAIAMNDSSAYNTNYQTIPQSICPKGWKLPTGMTGPSTAGDFAKLFYANSITNTLATQPGQNVGYNPNGFNNLRANPLYFLRSGFVNSGSLNNPGYYGLYTSSSVNSSSNHYNLFFNPGYLNPADYDYRYSGFSVRCLAR